MVGRLFYGLIAIGLILSLLGDLSVLQTGKEERVTGEWVNHSYEILQQVDATKLAVVRSQFDKTRTPNFLNQLERLERIVADTSTQTGLVMRLKELTPEQIFASNGSQALTILNEMSSAERVLLQERINRDQTTNQKSVRLAIFANAIDIFMILAALAFFVYERRKSQEMQKALTASLTHVESVNQRLQATLFRRNSKFKTAVHDLKNPLGSIRGFAELLQDEAGNNKSMIQMTQVIQRISNNTLGLIGSVLENEQEETASLEYVHILDCLKETCAFLEPIARSKNQHIVLEQDSIAFSFRGNPAKIQDVFYNLIGNALKFSPLGSIVSVRCAEDGDTHTIQIRDQGPGFATEDFSRVFQPGSKLSARPTGGEASTGIGLYSVKEAMTALGGTIEIANNPDRGACLTLRFPRLSGDPRLEPESPHQTLNV